MKQDDKQQGASKAFTSSAGSPAFVEFPKMPRMSRECIVTEKLDGTNAQIHITESGEIFAGSRTKWITPKDDNYGFAAWVEANRAELLTLGKGSHFGEWWGAGIQRRYGLKEKRFSLFNTARWCLSGNEPQIIPSADPRIIKRQDMLPPCCSLVPVLYQGMFSTEAVEAALADLRHNGSHAAPGFMEPEGVVCYHIAGGFGMKKTIRGDEVPKARENGKAELPGKEAPRA